MKAKKLRGELVDEDAKKRREVNFYHLSVVDNFSLMIGDLGVFCFLRE